MTLVACRAGTCAGRRRLHERRHLHGQRVLRLVAERVTRVLPSTHVVVHTVAICALAVAVSSGVLLGRCRCKTRVVAVVRQVGR